MVLDKLSAKLPEYMKSKDTLRLGVLRYLLSEIKNKEISFRTQGIELADKHVAKTLKKEMKKRKEAMEISQKAGRQDIFDKESAELEILVEFSELLPDYEF